MASKNRNKQVWFIPKRANVHQMIALLHGIINRNYDGTTWNTSKQDNLNLELKKIGATQSGNKIAPQGMRTLLASVHYLGFIYLDTTTTPTILRVTQAGYEFYGKHKNELSPIKNLSTGITINESESVLSQMSKLQITNPIILPHCEEIYVFPFRVTLEMIKSLDYLDMEEIAMFVFHTHSMSEIPFKIKEIKNFRNLGIKDRTELVNQYKETDIGKLTLKTAPSAGYFMAFCIGTGIIKKESIKSNSKKSISAIFIKNDMIKWVDELLQFHNDTETFNFGDNLDLWISYFGNPERLTPPTLLTVSNTINSELYIEIFDSQNMLIDTAILNSNDNYETPIFENENYQINIFNVNDGMLFCSTSFVSTKFFNFKIDENLIFQGNDVKYDEMFLSFSSLKIESLRKEILEHSKSRNFTDKMLVKLKLLQIKLGVDKIQDKSLRGAQYEYLFYLLLLQLKNNEIIDDVIWNGRIGDYNLPRHAPGGKNGTPDIIFIINDIRYVLELTTIKAKSTQFTLEGSSVPDHIRIYQEEFPNVKVKGIFCAPLVHKRVHNVMKQTILANSNIPFTSIKDEDLLNILTSENKKELLRKIDELF